MAKNYSVVFGSGDPRGFTGLAPTFIQFWNLAAGTTNTPPSITETVAGKTGVYTFSYGVTQPIQFLIDAATTSPGANGRYVTGQIDPADRSDEYGTTLTAIGFSSLVYGSSLFAQGVTLTAIGFSNLVYGASNFALGTTAVALGNTMLFDIVNIGSTLTGVGNTQLSFAAVLGSTSSNFGSTSIDPGDIFGMLKRLQEFNEGNQTYTKATGLLDFYNRGSSTLLREKTISDTTSQTTKT